MNAQLLRTVIDLNNMALHIQYSGGDDKLVELLQRAARQLEHAGKFIDAQHEQPTAFDSDEGTPA